MASEALPKEYETKLDLDMPLLRAENLKKHFILGGFLEEKRRVHAVDGVSFDLWKGETLGCVGESGCGKSTLCRVILRLYEPTEGKVYFEGRNINACEKKELKALRRNFQMIFQDPYSALNPRITVKKTLEEPLVIHKIGTKKERLERVKELLRSVGLSDKMLDRYPHEFSGGQRQRVGIARALALNPKLVVADEPVSALDVSIRAQILNLMMDLKEQLNLTYIIVAHDLSVIKHISDKVAVMYVGKFVEYGTTEQIYEKTKHPYTKALLSAVPVPDPEHKRKRIVLAGDVPSPINPPSGCRFHTRCWKAQDKCVKEEPEFIDIGEGHLVACHFPL